MNDQRTDASGLNIMQRVFDALSTDKGTSIHDLMMTVRVSRESIVRAIERLKAQRALEKHATRDANGVFLYWKRKDALRPMNRRGGGAKRQMMQEAA